MNLENLVHCDFCGLDFDPACAELSCTGCPLQRNCSKITCPNCGYPVLPEARLIGWIKKLRSNIGESQRKRPRAA